MPPRRPQNAQDSPKSSLSWVCAGLGWLLAMGWVAWFCQRKTPCAVSYTFLYRIARFTLKPTERKSSKSSRFPFPYQDRFSPPGGLPGGTPRGGVPGGFRGAVRASHVVEKSSKIDQKIIENETYLGNLWSAKIVENVMEKRHFYKPVLIREREAR